MTLIQTNYCAVEGCRRTVTVVRDVSIHIPGLNGSTTVKLGLCEAHWDALSGLTTDLGTTYFQGGRL